MAHGAAETSVILLDVGGMKCGGCTAGVKRRLLERPEVHSAAVNLVTGSAVVSVSASAAPSLAADLGQHITSQVAAPHNLLAATLLQPCALPLCGISISQIALWKRHRYCNTPEQLTSFLLAVASPSCDLGARVTFIHTRSTLL